MFLAGVFTTEWRIQKRNGLSCQVRKVLGHYVMCVCLSGDGVNCRSRGPAKFHQIRSKEIPILLNVTLGARKVSFA